MTTTEADLSDYDFSELPVGAKVTLPNGYTFTITDHLQGPSPEDAPSEEVTEEDILRQVVAVTLKRPITSVQAHEIHFLLDREGFSLGRKIPIQSPVVVDVSKMTKPYWDVATSVGLSLDRVFQLTGDAKPYPENEAVRAFISDLQGRGYAIVAPALKVDTTD